MHRHLVQRFVCSVFASINWRPATLLFASGVWAWGLVGAGGLQEGTQVATPTDYYTMTPPPAGGTYVDPVFGTTIKRMTDRTGEGFAVPVYSQTSSWNLDDTYMVLTVKGGGLGLYDADGNIISDRLQTAQGERVGLQSRARWSRINPRWLYYRGNEYTQIRRMDVVTGQAVDIGPQFSGTIDFARYGDLSDNDRVVVQRADRYVSVWDLIAGEQVSSQELDTSLIAPAFRSTTITPDGDSFLIGWSGPRGTSRGEGLEQFDVDGNFMVQLLDSVGHRSMGRDVDGTQAWFMTRASSGLADPPNCPNGLIKISLDGNATRTCVLPFVWGLGMHFSAHSNDGWVYVSTYDPQPPQPIAADPADTVAGDDDLWHLYTNEILRVRADGSVVERLAHTRSTGDRNFFWGQPHANISISGKKLTFGSDFMLDLHAGYVDTYVIDVAAAAPTLLGPSGAIVTRWPTYTWTKTAGAERYALWIDAPQGNVYTDSYMAWSICSFGTCSVTSPPAPALALGRHMFGVTAVTAAGQGLSSAPMVFNVGFRNYRHMKRGEGRLD